MQNTLQTTTQKLHWLSLESERELRTRTGNLITNTVLGFIPAQRSKD